MPKNKRYGDLRDLGRMPEFMPVKVKVDKMTLGERFKADVSNLKKGIKNQSRLAKRDIKKLIKKLSK